MLAASTVSTAMMTAPVAAAMSLIAMAAIAVSATGTCLPGFVTRRVAAE